MRTALITGGSRGLGRALAGELARDGWNLVIDARDPVALAAAASEIGAESGGAEGGGTEGPGGKGPGVNGPGVTGPGVTGIAGDVADPAHRADLVRAVSGGLDLLVNNASTLGPTPMPRLDSLPVAGLADILATNVLAPLALIQAVLPSLRERRGAILNITSDAAVENYAAWGGYGTSKAALEQLSNVLAAEEPDVAVWWADPGEMNTAMLRAAGEDADAAPPPAQAAAALHRLVRARPASGRYAASDLADAR